MLKRCGSPPAPKGPVTGSPLISFPPERGELEFSGPQAPAGVPRLLLLDGMGPIAVAPEIHRGVSAWACILRRPATPANPEPPTRPTRGAHSSVRLAPSQYDAILDEVAQPFSRLVPLDQLI